MTSSPAPEDAQGAVDGGDGGRGWSGPLATSIGAAQEALRTAGAAVRSLSTMWSLTPAQHLSALEEMAVVHRLADAVTFALADALDQRDRGDLDALGVTSAADALARAAGISHADAAKQLSLGASARPDRSSGDVGSYRRPALPLLGAALAAGAVSAGVFELAVTSVRSLPVKLRVEHLAALDAAMAAALPGLTHAEAKEFCATLLLKVDPDRADRGFDPDDLEKRRMRYTRHADGWVQFSGLLDPLNGAQLIAGLDHYCRPSPEVAAPPAPVDDDGNPLPAAEGADGVAADDAGVGPSGSGRGGDAAGGAQGGGVEPPLPALRDTRTLTQRRADAIGLIARQGVSNSETRGGEPPRVIINATQGQVDGVPGSGRAVCEQTGPIPSGALRTVLSRAVLQAVVFSGEGSATSVLSLGRSVRCFSAAQRRAMYARDGGCVYGCDAPLAWLEAHHVVEWAAGGLTDVASGVLVCPHHHTLTTLGVWEVRMVDGAPQILPPASVDPLRRWRWAPRRALQSHAAAVGEQLLLGLHLDDPPDVVPRRLPDTPPGAWRFADSPDPGLAA